MKYAVLLAAAIALGGCQTTTSAATKAAKCAGFQPVRYSSKTDSAATIKQARIHNATGRKLGCW
jgi:hypothetical protein